MRIIATRVQRRAAAPPLAHFVKLPERNSAMAQAYGIGCYSLKGIGQALGLHYATVSRVVRSVETGSGGEMEIAIHARAVGMFLAGAVGVFHASSFAGVGSGSVSQFAAMDSDVAFELVGHCTPMESPDAGVFFPNKGKSVPGHIYPAVALQRYKEAKHLPNLDLTVAKVSILEGPLHGKLLPLNDSDPDLGQGFQYSPTAGHRGADYVTALVEYKGQRIKVKSKLVVVEAILDSGSYRNGNSGGGLDVDREANDCIYKSTVRRIGLINNKLQPLTQWADVILELANYEKRFDFVKYLVVASGISLVFVDTPSSAIGETTGEGLSAQITLDTDAAGHGWYVDPTPLDNTDDYLPTSNPNEWIAKAGTDAAGKTDLLSVPLHEYAHALALEHRADARDFMATTLTSGAPRLPIAS